MKKLIKLLITDKVERVIVSYQDRLIRFGIEIIEQICELKHVKIEVVNPSQSKSFEEELAVDVLTIPTVFCSKIYGRRSHQRQKKRKEKLVANNN